MLTGHAGYFNVGVLYRVGIPGLGVSCAIRISVSGDGGIQ